MLSRFSRVQLFAMLQTGAYQAPLSIGFSRQEYWSGVPFPLPEDLPDPGIKPESLCLLHWQVDSLPKAPPGKPKKTVLRIHKYKAGSSLSRSSSPLMEF